MYIAQPQWGGLVAEPMVAAPGYSAAYRIKVTAQGSGATASSYTQDGMAAFASLVTLKDSFGTPIIVAPGWESFHLIPLISGQFGIHETQEPGNLPSFVPGTLTDGGWSFSSQLPWEFAKAYGLFLHSPQQMQVSCLSCR